MSFAKPIVLGNWKMNGLKSEGLALAGALAEKATKPSGTLGVFPPATLIDSVRRRLEGTEILVGGQDCHDRNSGAFTGSISPLMLADCGAEIVLIGHSERRHGLNEDDDLIARKVHAALGAGLDVVLCVGETEDEYLSGKQQERLRVQLAAAVPEIAGSDNFLVAYEPVWAIGTGRTPSVDEIGATHGFIRERLAELVSSAPAMGILYGGSVKPSNASEILLIPDVDGVLIGGASLDANDFWSIYAAGGGT